MEYHRNSREHRVGFMEHDVDLNEYGGKKKLHGVEYLEKNLPMLGDPLIQAEYWKKFDNDQT